MRVKVFFFHDRQFGHLGAGHLATSGPTSVECSAPAVLNGSCWWTLRMDARRNRGYFCPFGLDVRTLAFCQLMGFPLNHKMLNF